MGRTSIILTEDQERLINSRARTEGITKAEVLRRIIDASLSERSTRSRRSSARPGAGQLSEIDDWPSWLTKVR